ncbi:MAG TPA: AMP-binding protein [Acidimicrobiia bacterium]|nr:AMP-binding protein [Acidimicrobiia bacterium]
MSDHPNLWELIVARAAATPDAVLAVDEREQRLTAQDLHDRAEVTAAGLHRLGVDRDTPVSWMLPTRLDAAVLVGALARLGAVQNPILPMLGPRETRFITTQTNARMLLVPGVWRGRAYADEAHELREDRPDLQVVVVDDAHPLPAGDRAALPPPPPSTTPAEAPVRWVFYTSGTTADPKGAQHTDHTVKASADGMLQALEMGPDDRTAIVFPFTHIGGIALLYTILVTGCTGVFVEAFVPPTTIPILQRETITLAGAGTTFHLAYLAAQRAQPDVPLFPAVRAFPGGAAPKPPNLHYELKAELGGVGIVSGYGLTEAPILTMNTVRGTDEQLAETEGPPTPGVELRVVRLDGTVAAPGEEGEIRAKGPQVFRGYLDGSLDADAFDDEGWIRTGDLGVLRPDRHVRITGRVKDVIIRKGETISAKEVEDLLFTHPRIADVAVIGVPDARLGERSCAVVVASETTAPTLSEIFEFLTGEGLTVQKVPEQLEVVDALPRNASGKVLKQDLRAVYGTAEPS